VSKRFSPIPSVNVDHSVQDDHQHGDFDQRGEVRQGDADDASAAKRLERRFASLVRLNLGGSN
jgi:hypothetical protein